MRKGRLFISGMLGFWLWLAGMPANHDTAGGWLAGGLPRAHAADLGGNLDVNTTLNEDSTVSSVLTFADGVELTVSSGYKLTLNARLASNPAAARLINNGTTINTVSNPTNLNIDNYGNFTTSGWFNYAPVSGHPIFTNYSGATITNDGVFDLRGYGVLENYGTLTNNYDFWVQGTLNNRSGGKIENNMSTKDFDIGGTLNNEYGGEITNSGNIRVGTLNNGGTLTNNAGGTIEIPAGQLNNQAGGLLVNRGTLLINTKDYAGGIVNNSGTLQNYGRIATSATFTILAGEVRSVLNNYGTLTNNAGAAVDNYGVFNNGTQADNANATLTNYGTFNTSLAAGTVGTSSFTVGSTTNYGAITNYGTFTGDRFTSYGTVKNYGTFTCGVNYGTFTNTGTITSYIMSNNILTNSGTIYNWQNGQEANVGGVYTPTTAVMTNSGTAGDFTNFGQMTNTAAGVITVVGMADHKSGELINNGRIINNGTYRCYNDPTTDDVPSWPLLAATLTNNGTFTNRAGAIFYNMGGATVSNNGTFYNYGSFTNMAYTAWRARSGTVTNTGTIYNYGTMTNQDGSTFTSSGALYNYGTITNAAGSTLTVTGGTVYGPIVNNGTFTVSGGSFTLPSAGQTLSITNLSGSAAFRVAGITAGSPAVTVTGTAAGSHTFTVTGSGAASGTLKAVDLPAGSTATFSGGGDVGAYYCTLASGATLGLDAEDYYFASSGRPSSLTKTAMGLTGSTTTVWYGEMNEVRKRMGELRLGGQSADGLWARGYASKFSVRPAGADSFRQTMHGFELGHDNPQSFAGGRKYTGFVAGYGTADNSYAGGSGTTDSCYLGVYGSWLRDDGAYFDLIGKFNHFSPRFTTASDHGSYDSAGFGLSAELGKRFERGDGFFVEPAVELSALWTKRAAYTTAGGLAVEVPAATSLQLRLGVTGGKKWTDSDGASRQLYAKASWVNEYKGDSTTRVDGANFDSSLRGHQWVAGLGFVEDNGKRQIYFDAEKSWGRSVSKDWGANLGCRWRF